MRDQIPEIYVGRSFGGRRSHVCELRETAAQNAIVEAFEQGGAKDDDRSAILALGRAACRRS
jgi:hypothetical protein